MLSRQVRHAGAEFAEALALTGTAQAADATDADEPALGRRRALWFARHEGQLAQLRRALEESRGNMSEAARQVGLSRSAAMRLIEADTSRKQGQRRL